MTAVPCAEANEAVRVGFARPSRVWLCAGIEPDDRDDMRKGNDTMGAGWKPDRRIFRARWSRGRLGAARSACATASACRR